MGLVASALSSCAGVAPDSNAIKVAGSNYLTTRISNYKDLKDLQKKVYKYEKNVHNVMDVNDVQKYSITAEQYKDNLKLIGILEDSLIQQKAFKSSLSVARGIASTNIHQMKEHLTLCIVDIYYAAWHEIIYTEPKIEKFPGICGLHGALVGYAADVYCPAYLFRQK